jgi:hypothetical protein
MTPQGGNGGFPEPPAGDPVRVVRCSHLTCRSETRIRLPHELPAEVVRRVVCDGCGRTYDCHLVEELEVLPPARADGRWLDQPPSRAWRIASIPIAAAAVIGALLLIRGLEEEDTRAPGGQRPAVSRDVHLVREPTYSLALPARWERTDPPAGATFAARAADGSADATLFVDRDPSLDFATFEARSLDRLRDLAGSAEVAERVTGPTLEEMIARLQSEPQPGGKGIAYAVTLRASGPYRYYLSTTRAPDATPDAREGVELIHSSFFPSPE